MPTDKQVTRLIGFILAANEFIPWYAGYVYNGHTISRRDGGYFLVIRAERGKGERVVSFYGGHTPFDCWQAFTSDLLHHSVKWSYDKYAS